MNQMRRLRGVPQKSHRGFASIVLVAMVALIGGYLIVGALNQTSNEVRMEQDVRTRDVLKEAKTALITYAAKEAWNYSASLIQPGGLPCPDTDNDGEAEANCSVSAAQRTGRLPWKTIGTSDLRDANGERLWYGLSNNFRSAYGSTIINSDTAGTLTVNGMAPASNLVAVVIAPGQAVQDTATLPTIQIQDRSAANINRAASYLEHTNYSGTDTYADAAPGANGVYNAAATSFNSPTQSRDFFNDRIATISQAELMAVVEPAVAARIERDIKPYLTAYATQWSGKYPFPATFPQNNNTQSSYSGSTSAASGLLPLTASASYSWTTGSGSASLAGGTAQSLSGITCALNAIVNWRCSFTIRGVDLGIGYASSSICANGATRYRYCIINPILNVSGAIGTSAGLTFADIPNATAVTSSRSPISTASISGTLSSTGVGTITYQATYGYSSFSNISARTRTINFTIPAVDVSALTTSTNPDTGWFITQQWYRQTHYAVSPAYLPGGSGSCNPLPGTPSCLTVNNLPSSYTTANDKRAILVFAGRTLNSANARPSSTLSHYLENQNATPNDYIFEHHAGTTTTINDRVIVIAP